MYVQNIDSLRKNSEYAPYLDYFLSWYVKKRYTFIKKQLIYTSLY